MVTNDALATSQHRTTAELPASAHHFLAAPNDPALCIRVALVMHGGAQPEQPNPVRDSNNSQVSPVSRAQGHYQRMRALDAYPDVYPNENW